MDLRKSASLLLGFVLLAGTSHAQGKRRTYKLGELDNKGRMVVFVDRTGLFEIPFWLEDPYAVMLVNEGKATHQRIPRYILANRRARKVVETHNIGIFRKALLGLPKNARVRLYDSCTVSLSYGLRPYTLNEFDKALKAAHLKLPPEPNIICICDSRG